MSTVVKPLDHCSASWMFTLTITNSAAAGMQEPTVVMVVLHFRGFISINNAQWDYTWYTLVQYIHSSYITVHARTLVYSSYITVHARTLVYSSYIYITVHAGVPLQYIWQYPLTNLECPWPSSLAHTQSELFTCILRGTRAVLLCPFMVCRWNSCDGVFWSQCGVLSRKLYQRYIDHVTFLHGLHVTWTYIGMYWSPTSRQPSKLSIYRLATVLKYYSIVYGATLKLGCKVNFCPVYSLHILWQEQLMTLMHQFYGAVLLQDDISMTTAAMVTGKEDHTPSILVRLHYT